MVNTSFINCKSSLWIPNQRELGSQSCWGLDSNFHVLSDLLPYDLGVKTHSRLIDGLKEYLLLLVAAEESINSLTLGRLKDFDPLVGENACQIRAVRLALIVKNDLINVDQLSQAVKKVKNNVVNLLNNPAMVLSSGISLEEALKSKELKVSVNESEIFVIMSYMLTKVKVLLPPSSDRPLTKNEHTDTKKIKEISEVGSMFAGNFVKSLREQMSATSVRFVQELAKDMFLSEPISQLLSDRYLVEHRKLHCLPCFATARVLMHQALRNHIPIVMFAEQRAKDQNYKVIEKAVLFFQPTSEGYVEVEYSSMNPLSPSLYFLGNTAGELKNLKDKKSWCRELSTRGPMDLILAYAAAHRQYPNASKDALLSDIQDAEYAYYKAKADEWGCSLENPSCFFLSHAFCDRVQNFQKNSFFSTSMVGNRIRERCSMSIKRNFDQVSKVSMATCLPSKQLGLIDHCDHSGAFQKRLPVTAIDVRRMNENFLISKNKLAFFYHVMLKTIESCLSMTYSNFDAHTTSTCCHGIALLVQDLIVSINKLDLKNMQQEGLRQIKALNDHDNVHQDYPCTWWVPEPLLHLARLYILALAKTTDLQRGILTCKINLKSIHQVSTRFCDQIVDSLQKHFSNLVALRYSHCLEKIPDGMEINGIPVRVWGKYTQPAYLRVDKQGIYYAPAMFSMQVSLAYLISSKLKAVIINDVVEEVGQARARYVSIFEGDGHGHMQPLAQQALTKLWSHPEQPVVVFGGCVHSDEERVTLQMRPWLNQFSSLILACDAWYPQFPRVIGDAEFDSSPIIPHEDCLNRAIANHSKIEGVAAENPSLFCLTHVYPASMKQVLNVLYKNDEMALPVSFIPSQRVSMFSV